MGRRKKQRPHIGDPNDPLALTPLVATYLQHLRVVNLSKWTVVNNEMNLHFFIEWCGERGIMRVSEVTRPMILQYQRAVFHYRTPAGEMLGFAAQLKRLTAVVAFFKWVTRENLILYNPATEIDLPRVPKRLPKHVLSLDEVDRVMSQPDVTDAIGIRDRAILELFYSAGLRRAELMNLRLYDLDLERGTIVVRQGKGQRDRIVPIGERAIAWLQKYLADVRVWFACDPDEGYVFLTHRGARLSRNQLSHLVHEYVKQADIGKKGSCHLFRHAMATLMLENGADIRYIQQMLGHRSLETTEIYTHVSIRKLKEIHSMTHPAGRVERRLQSDRDSLPRVDSTALHEHVDAVTEAAAARDGERRYERAARSQALKVLRTSARERAAETRAADAGEETT